MTGPCFPIRTDCRFHRDGRSLTLLSAPIDHGEEDHAAPEICRTLLIVLPPGPERTRCYRLLRELAATLASSGVPVLRLELSGSGHSAQNTAATRLSDWHEDLHDALLQLRSRWPAAQLLGLGVRYGARLLLDSLTHPTHASELEGLVCWSPLLRGCDWVAHLQGVQSQMCQAGLQLDQQDLAGEQWSAEFLTELQAQTDQPDLAVVRNLLSLVLDVDSKIDNISVNNQYNTDISSNDWRSEALPMMSSADTSAALLTALQAPLPTRSAEDVHGSRTALPNNVSNHLRISEQPFRLGGWQAPAQTTQAQAGLFDEGLFGIYRPGRASCPVVVMLNSGLVDCAGPYRLYVDIAQRLSEQGIASARLDFSGKGESPRKRLSGRQALLDDYAQLSDFLRAEGHQQIILLGICSGADDALELAEAADNVAGLVLLDGYAPKTANYTLHYLLQRLRSPQRILRWLRRQSRAVLTNVGIGRHSAPSPTHPGARSQGEKRVLELRHWESSAVMRARYLEVLDRQCATLAVFTGALQDDYYNHAGQLTRALGSPKLLSELHRPHLSHLYPSSSQRTEVIGLIADWATENFGAGTTGE